eukprot:scaffold1311_cov99-Cylindrotheca_fusiformis.AAC.10
MAGVDGKRNLAFVYLTIETLRCLNHDRPTTWVTLCISYGNYDFPLTELFREPPTCSKRPSDRLFCYFHVTSQKITHVLTTLTRHSRSCCNDGISSRSIGPLCRRGALQERHPSFCFVSLEVMNHLCGLEFLKEDPSSSNSSSTSSWWKDELIKEERDALVQFQFAHQQGRPSSSSSNGGGGSSNGNNTPKFGMDPNLVHEDETRNKEDGGSLIVGWRELDEFTLYRFLCADAVVQHNKNNNGPTRKFHPKKSLDRLQRALHHRVESKADAVLEWWMKRRQQQQQQPKKNNIRNNSPMTTIPFASTSLATGSIIINNDKDDDDDNANDIEVENVRIVPHHQVLHPGFSSLELSKYQRLRIRRFTGRDYEGRPVLFERLGAFLGSGNHVHFSHEEWMRLYIWDLERHFLEMRQAAQDTGKPIQQYVFCGDGQGIVSAIMNRSIWKVIPLLKSYKSVEEYYPEIASTIILFNVPKVATFFYKVVRSFLDPATAAKINIYSNADYEQVFSNLMPLNAVPKEYGGTSEASYPVTATS